MKLHKKLTTLAILLLIFGGCKSVVSAQERGGSIEICFPDSINGYIECKARDSIWRIIDTVQVANGKCVIEYSHQEMPTLATLLFFETINKKNGNCIWIHNPYNPDECYGNIVLDNTHTVIKAKPRMNSVFFCTNECVDGSGEGRLEMALPDSIHGLVKLLKIQGGNFTTLDSASVVNGKCVFTYKTSNIPNESIRFSVQQTGSFIIPMDKEKRLEWNNLLKNHTLIKADVTPKLINTGIISTISGSPESDIQLQLMGNTSGCRDRHGYISKEFIAKHPNSKLLLKEVFYDRNSYSFTDDLAKVVSLFSEECRQSSIAKKLNDYIEKTKEHEKYGIARSFAYFDANGKEYNFDDCINGKQFCVVVLWASWCGPCLKEIPHLKEFYKMYKDKIALVSLSIDDNYIKWTDRMKEYPVEWLSLSGLPKDKRKVINDSGITSVPSFMILDSKGKFVCTQYIQNGNGVRLIELEDIEKILNKRLK